MTGSCASPFSAAAPPVAYRAWAASGSMRSKSDTQCADVVRFVERITDAGTTTVLIDTADMRSQPRCKYCFDAVLSYPRRGLAHGMDDLHDRDQHARAPAGLRISRPRCADRPAMHLSSSKGQRSMYPLILDMNLMDGDAVIDGPRPLTSNAFPSTAWRYGCWVSRERLGVAFLLDGEHSRRCLALTWTTCSSDCGCPAIRKFPTLLQPPCPDP
jgi:hypothetical protein